METGISINKYIYSILSKDENLAKLVGKNIFPLVAEEGASFPFLIYKRTNIITEYTKDGRFLDKVEFIILIVSNKYFNSVDIAERVRSMLEGRTDTTIRNTTLTTVDEDYIDDSYVQKLTFSTIVR